MEVGGWQRETLEPEFELELEGEMGEEVGLEEREAEAGSGFEEKKEELEGGLGERVSNELGEPVMLMSFDEPTD